MSLHEFGRSRLHLSGLVIAVGCGLGMAAMPVQAQQRTSAPLTNPSTLGSSRSIEDGNRLQWVFFPVNPPVLGAEVAVVAASRQTSTPNILRAFLTEPFYAPLAVRVVQVEGEPRRNAPFSPEEYVKLDSFLGIRAALVTELYDRSDRFLRLDAGSRLAAFEDLARTQQDRLAEMERIGEWLRDSLARTDPWSEYRRWRLNRGSLKQPRDKTYVLEFQVVRAAAYYQPGFSPAQRRLIRELTIEMNEAIAMRGRPEGVEFMFFFSPETARVMRPQGAPPELDALIERFIADKRALKEQLRDVIYETDGILLEYTRTRRIEELAAAQAVAIDELEALAERIRRGIADLADYRRFRGAPRFDSRVEERLHTFAESVEKLERDRAEFIRDRVRKARTRAPGESVGQVVYESAARARAVFEMEQGNRLMAHEREAEALFADLLEVLPPEEAGRLNGSADVAIREFLERRAEQDAYVDYDLAALEPGLSPEQRRLMLASAMMRLRQVMLPPELQPTDPPGTLLGLGETAP